MGIGATFAGADCAFVLADAVGGVFFASTFVLTEVFFTAALLFFADAFGLDLVAIFHILAENSETPSASCNETSQAFYAGEV